MQAFAAPASRSIEFDGPEKDTDSFDITLPPGFVVDDLPPDVDADYPGLEGKKVVVVCRPLALQQYRDAGSAKDLANQVAKILKQNVSKIKIVEQKEVAATPQQLCQMHPVAFAA